MVEMKPDFAKQRGSGTTRSRPFPARAAKRVESALHHNGQTRPPESTAAEPASVTAGETAPPAGCPMPANPMHPPHHHREGIWFVPTIEMRLPAGELLIKTLKPVLVASASQTAKWTGLSKKKLRNLAEAGFIREARPTPQTLLYYPGEVWDFIRQTEADPDFWNGDRLTIYLRARRSRDPRHHSTAAGAPKS